MWSYLKLVLLFLFCASAAVRRVKLPGGCPQVPATHYWPKSESLPYEIIQAVPFTNSDGLYLFSNEIAKNFKAFDIKIVLGRYQIEIELKIKKRMAYDVTVSCINYSLNLILESFLLGCSVHHKQVQLRSLSICYPKIWKEIRSWLDGEFVILWSCEENTKTGQHEEAVILMRLHNSSTLSTHKEYVDMIRRLNETARRYLK